MKHEKVCGGTTSMAELVVEYDKKNKPKMEIKGIPEENKWNAVTSSYFDWWSLFLKFWIIASGTGFVLGLILILFNLENLFISKFYTVNTLAASFVLTFLLAGIVSLIHTNSKFNEKWKKHFAEKTGDKPRTKATFSQFTSKVFVIYDIRNIVVEYDASGDVAKQLKKVWIREDPCSSVLEQQANVRGLVWEDGKKENAIWNAYFFFKRIPKNGELYVEWI